MSVREVAAMIREHSGAEPADHDAEALHRRTEGNPFFVTELLRLEGAAGLRSGPVPVGVRDVVRRRIARLPEPAQAFLSTAAVAGRDFDFALVAGLCGFDPDTGLEAAEAALIDRAIVEIPERIGGYRFAHALVRETLAGDLAPMQRARLHARIAEALLAAGGDGGATAIEAAEHLWASLPAGDRELTLRTLARAAEHAWAGLAYEQTEVLLDRASTLLTSIPSSPEVAGLDLDVHLRLGSVRSVRHGYTPEVRDAFDRARVLAERLSRRGDVLPALWGLGATAVVRADLESAAEFTDAALEVAREDGGAMVLAAGHQGVGIVAFYSGRLADARRHFADSFAAWALARAEQAAPPGPAPLRGPPANARPDVMAAAYDALAAQVLGDPDAAERRMAGSVQAAAASGQPYPLAFALSFAARLHVLRRDPRATAAVAERAIAVAGEHGFPLLTEHAAIPLGWAEALDGRPQRGLDRIEAALAELSASGQRILTPFHQALQAEALLVLGDTAGAQRVLDDALAECARRGGGFESAELHRLRDLARRS
jgi:hypothetical protein